MQTMQQVMGRPLPAAPAIDADDDFRRAGDDPGMRGNLRGDLVFRGAADPRDGDPAALGAAPAAIRGMVLREGMAMAAAGIGAGVAAALALTRYLQSLLYVVTPTDGEVYAAVCAVLAAVAAAGCWFPARRATAVDPALVLREE